MNRQEGDILRVLLAEPYVNQRILAETCGHSVGVVNRSIRNLVREGYLNEQIHLTEKALRKLENCRPRNAIILAAGTGMHMISSGREVSKGLLEVNGEPLIERLIRQLHEADVREIYVVVGFMKDCYEYLIDEYGVELIVNSDYASKNNLHSMSLVTQHLSDSYIVPCDIWCRHNLFQKYELYSWYMIGHFPHENFPDGTFPSGTFPSGKGNIRMNRKSELVPVSDGMKASTMIGICYLAEEQAVFVRDRIGKMCREERFDHAFWEEALWNNGKIIVPARVVDANEVTEINTADQLSELNHHANRLQKDALCVIAGTLKAAESEIVNISVLKKGMTNRSFLFTCKGRKYIIRIPGEGTEQLIDRKKEESIYRVIEKKHICDDVIYMNSENGYKITGFLENARVCDPLCEEDVKKCMNKLRDFHEMELAVPYEIDLFKQIDFYEALWQGKPSVFKDYRETKRHVLSLQDFINAQVKKKVLTHIDAVPDNFLFTERDGEEEIRLIDWEYAGMQDPHVDIAMFGIYALYDKKRMDKLISLYFREGCSDRTRVKIYCYIAVCGLLWSNWCEYKRSLGVEFGEYSLRQYRFAKEYYRFALDGIRQLEET